MFHPPGSTWAISHEDCLQATEKQVLPQVDPKSLGQLVAAWMRAKKFLRILGEYDDLFLKAA